MYSFCNLNNVVGDILRSNRKKERHAPVQGLREEFECLIHSEMLAAQCNEKKKFKNRNQTDPAMPLTPP